MPIYDFTCDSDKEGCGQPFEATCSMQDISSFKPKCPICHSNKKVIQVYNVPYVSVPRTLGSLADKNSAKMSSDYKNHLSAKHTAYLNQPFTGKLPDGVQALPRDKDGKRA